MSIASLPSSSPVTPPKKWTVLLYSAADNNLYPYMYDDVAELETVGSDANTNLVVQIDHGRQGPGAQRLSLEKKAPVTKDDPPVPGAHGKIQSPVVDSLGQVNMSSAYTLADSIKWAITKYPAQHYALIISDHGNNWKGCVQDDSAHGWMSVPELKSGLALAQKDTGVKLDVLGFDCCLMASTEVAYQLRDQASYMVASEMTEGADGLPYAPIFGPDTFKEVQTRLEQRIDMEPRDLATMLVDQSSTTSAIHTLSAIDLSKMNGVKDTMKELREAMVASPTEHDVFRSIWKSCTRFYGYRDAGDFTNLINLDPRISDENLKQKAVAAHAALTEAVMAEQHIGEFGGATGLTIQLHKSTDLSYNNLEFEKDTRWTAAQNRVGPLEEGHGLSEMEKGEASRPTWLQEAS